MRDTAAVMNKRRNKLPFMTFTSFICPDYVFAVGQGKLPHSFAVATCTGVCRCANTLVMRATCALSAANPRV